MRKIDIINTFLILNIKNQAALPPSGAPTRITASGICKSRTMAISVLIGHRRADYRGVAYVRRQDFRRVTSRNMHHNIHYTNTCSFFNNCDMACCACHHYQKTTILGEQRTGSASYNSQASRHRHKSLNIAIFSCL